MTFKSILRITSQGRNIAGHFKNFPQFQVTLTKNNTAAITQATSFTNFTKFINQRIPVRAPVVLLTRQFHSSIKFQQKQHVSNLSSKRGALSQIEESSSEDSDSDADESKSPRRGESAFWRQKMRTLHRILDVNKDGVISYDDFKLLADRFVALGHLTEQEASNFQNILQKLWEENWGEITQYNFITVEQYLEDMHEAVNNKNIKVRAQSFLPYLFMAVDKDRSGEISVEEFKLFFSCLGIAPEYADVTFKIIDHNHDGKLSRKEFIKLGRDFFIAEDESRVSRMFWGPLAD